MATAPKPTKTYENVPAGTHTARLYQIMYLGTTAFEYKGEMKTSNKVRLTFELPDEMREFGEDKQLKPMSISREFGFSMGKKSHLRPFVEGILGVALHDEEAYAFDLDKLLGEPCLLSVAHVEKDGNTYANIKSAAPMMKNMKAPEPFNPTAIIDVNTATEQEIDALPGFLRDKMKASDEYKARFGSGADIQLDDTKSAEVDESNPF